MPKQNKINLLGAPVDCLTMEKAGERMAELIDSGRPGQVITLNPEILYQAVTAGTINHGLNLLDLLRQADLVTADGEGIVWAAKIAGSPVPERVTGIDLMLHLIPMAAASGWSVYFLGAAPGVAEQAAANLQRQYPNLRVAGTMHGYFKPEQEQQVVQQIINAQPRLLFVALGAPRQEFFIHQYLKQMGPVVAMGVGGSFDVVAGQVTRVPGWLQRYKLEWLGRLLQQPSRWRRMLVLPKFVWLVLTTYRLPSKSTKKLL